MQLIQGDLFKDFPDAASDHSAWRRRGALPLGPLPRPGAGHEAAAARHHVMKNVFFDTCVYHQPGIDLLLKVIPVDNILFRLGNGGRGAGHRPDHRLQLRRHQALHRCLRAVGSRTSTKIFEGNAHRVYPRLKARLAAA